MDGYGSDEKILFVCTANICRSPMAEALMRSELGSRFPEVHISSAGFMSDGKAADRKSIWAMRRLGLDLGGHSSTRVSRALENKPDLILTMSGEHLQLLAELDSGMSERAFTLKEFVELADIEGPRRSREQMADYVSRVSAGRSFSGLTSPNRAKDIGDPIGRRKRAFYKCAMELKDLIHLLSILLYDIDTTPPPQEGLSPSPRTEAESSGDTD